MLAIHWGLNVSQNDPFNKVLRTVSEEAQIVTQHRAALTRLNSARVMFKHQGLSTLQKNDVIVFAGNVHSFLLDVCNDCLNIDFDSVSLADAIVHCRTRNWIKKAEDSFQARNFDSVLTQASEALAIYMSQPAIRSSGLRRSAVASFSLGFGHSALSTGYDLSEHFSEFARTIAAGIENLDNRVHLISRGVDLIAFDQFIAIAPHTTITLSGKIHSMSNALRETVTVEDARFGIDTVIDTVLALQNHQPISRLDFRTPTIELKVLQDTDIIVYPDEASPEIIRQARRDENLEGVSPSRSSPNEEYVSIIQDGDIAYVSKHHVEAISKDSEVPKKVD